MKPDSRIRFRPSPALVVASIALAVSLGGTGYAAFKLPAGSVGTAQLKAGAVTSLKVKNGSLLRTDFKPGQLAAAPQAAGPQGPAGLQGPKGDKGDKGDTGSPGLSGLERVEASTAADTSPLKAVSAPCPAGKKVVGGGGFALGPNTTGAPRLISSGPTPDLTKWSTVAGVTSTSYAASWLLTSWAICANVAS